MAVNNTPLEKDECYTLVAYLRVKGYKFSAIMNETGSGQNAKRIGVRNKRMGMSPGVPDYIIIVDDNLLWCEMKRQKGGTVSAYQKGWIEALENAGQTVRVCRGAGEAIDFIESIAKHGV